MDVNKADWPYMLQPMLTALSNAHFVSIDLELSGISNKTARLKESKEEDLTRKQTLQERYTEMKAAAEKYQVLQMGITTVREDVERGVYIARPYNIYLNPVVGERLNIDRIFSFQSSAVDFLMTHGFSIEGPFYNGLPYLSREEEATAIKGERTRLDRTSVADIHLNENETEALDLVRTVRQKVKKWLKLTSRPDFLNVAPESYQVGEEMQRGFSPFHRRLIHQLIRAEHPELVSVPMPGFIQIKFLDPKQEENVLNARLEAFNEKVRRQVGLRWFVEGMVGGSLNQIDPTTFVRTVNGRPVWYDKKKLGEDFAALRQRVVRHRTVLVGHNMFTDLLNFYRCFFGTLPEDLREFKRKIHELFPLIIDTKYLATHFKNSSDTRSGLEELDCDLAGMPVPVMECHPHHQRYMNDRPSHEAGYDSYMTARVAIRISAKLEALGYYVENKVDPNAWDKWAPGTEKMQSSLEEDFRVPKRYQNFLQDAPEPRAPQSDAQFDLLDSLEATDPAPVAAFKVSRDQDHNSWRQASAIRETLAGSSNRSSPTRASESLKELVQDGLASSDLASGAFEEPRIQMHSPDARETATEMLGATSQRTQAQKPKQDARIARGTFVDKKPVAGIQKKELVIPTFMPHFANDFWRVYGNKLRVNGTVEEVCDLNGA